MTNPEPRPVCRDCVATNISDGAGGCFLPFIDTLSIDGIHHNIVNLNEFHPNTLSEALVRLASRLGLELTAHEDAIGRVWCSFHSGRGDVHGRMSYWLHHWHKYQPRPTRRSNNKPRPHVRFRQLFERI